MSFTERFVRADAAGGGDGSTDTNSGASGAWTFAEGLTNEAAGQRINWKAGTYTNTTTGRTFAAVGTTTAPIWWRGFKTTPGDQDTNNVAVPGTDIPAVTFTTGQMVVSGAHHIHSKLDIASQCTTASGAVNITGAGCRLDSCRIVNTAANSAARALSLTNANEVTGCYLKATTTASVAVNLNTIVRFFGNVVTGGITGANLLATGSVILNCIFDSQAGDAIQLANLVQGIIIGNSIYAPLGNGVNFTTGVYASGNIVANNIFSTVNQASKAAINNSTGTNTNFILCVGNAFYNCTANISGMGDSPLLFDNGTLASDPFVNAASQNFTLNSVAKALGYPGKFENISAYQGYLDPGAVQRQEPAGGGMISGRSWLGGYVG